MDAEEKKERQKVSEHTLADGEEVSEVGMVKRRRVGGRSAQVRAAVFRAVLDLLLTEGYHALTIGEIASRSGVHETSIYRRWQSVERLVGEVLIEHARTILPMPDTGNVRADLVQLLREVVAFLQSPIGEAMVQIGVASRSLPAQAFEDYWSSRVQQFDVVVQRAIARGELPADLDESLFLTTLIGPLYVQMLLLKQTPDENLPTRIVDLVLDGVWRGAQRKSERVQ